jgi:hypothetical protein
MMVGMDRRCGCMKFYSHVVSMLHNPLLHHECINKPHQSFLEVVTFNCGKGFLPCSDFVHI